jgi:beta-lactamase class C
MLGRLKTILLITAVFFITTFLYIKGTSEEQVVRRPFPSIDSTLIKLKDDLKGFEAMAGNGIEMCNCPGAAIVVVKDTSIVLMKEFGKRSVKDSLPVDAHTVFRIGSLSKGFASIVSGILVERGMFSFDDKVVKYFPRFELKSREQTDRITIRNILSHTSGLPRHTYTNLIEQGWSIDSIASILKEVNLAGKEGEVFAYQNATYSMIEEVIKSVTSKDYSQILSDEIFKKCGMADASCSYESITQRDDKAFPHNPVSQVKYKEVPITKKYYNSISSGGVNVSISDMAKWIQLLLGNRPDIISNAMLDRIFEPVINTNHERILSNHWKGAGSSFYAMGWRVIDYNGRRIVYHGGFVNGFRSEIVIDRTNKIGFCALFNTACEYSSQVVHDFLTFYDNRIPESDKPMLAEQNGKTKTELLN